MMENSILAVETLNIMHKYEPFYFLCLKKLHSNKLK